MKQSVSIVSMHCGPRVLRICRQVSGTLSAFLSRSALHDRAIAVNGAVLEKGAGKWIEGVGVEWWA